MCLRLPSELRTTLVIRYPLKSPRRMSRLSFRIPSMICWPTDFITFPRTPTKPPGYRAFQPHGMEPNFVRIVRCKNEKTARADDRFYCDLSTHAVVLLAQSGLLSFKCPTPRTGKAFGVRLRAYAQHLYP